MKFKYIVKRISKSITAFKLKFEGNKRFRSRCSVTLILSETKILLVLMSKKRQKQRKF